MDCDEPLRCVPVARQFVDGAPNVRNNLLTTIKLRLYRVFNEYDAGSCSGSRLF
jgi:hypothetical protein